MYVIIGRRENGDLAIYDRRACLVDEAEAATICANFNYDQLLVVEAEVGGYAQRYEYTREPTIRAVPMTGNLAMTGSTG